MVVSTDESINNVAIRRCTAPLKTYQFICYDLLCVCVCRLFIGQLPNNLRITYRTWYMASLLAFVFVCVSVCVLGGQFYLQHEFRYIP